MYNLKPNLRKKLETRRPDTYFQNDLFEKT